jgi:hypothetical protein
MSSNVYCSDEIFKQIKTMFHTLNWKCTIQHNRIQFYRKHFELEIFQLEITDKYIYFTIPFLDAQVNYSKRVPLEHCCDGFQFLQYHVDNYVKTIVSNKHLYEDNCYYDDVSIRISRDFTPSKQLLISSAS